MNIIKAHIRHIHCASGIVLVDLEAGNCLLSALMMEQDGQPDWLKSNNSVKVIIKETEISIAKNFSGKISMRNQIDCVVKSIDLGHIMSIVHLEAKGFELKSAITTRSVQQLEIVPGDTVTALIKSNELSLMAAQ